MTVREDLSLTGLNFGVLRRKQLRKWRFYSCVVVLQCFAAFTIHVTAPIDAARELMPQVHQADSWALKNGNNLTFSVPQHSTWMYVPPMAALFKDPFVNETITKTLEKYGRCETTWPGWLGYVVGVADNVQGTLQGDDGDK